MKRTEFLVMINFDVVKYAVEVRKTISYRTSQYDRYISYRYINRNKNVGVLLQLKYRSYQTILVVPGYISNFEPVIRYRIGTKTTLFFL